MTVGILVFRVCQSYTVYDCVLLGGFIQSKRYGALCMGSVDRDAGAVSPTASGRVRLNHCVRSEVTDLLVRNVAS